jgi:superfamily II DNA or RNA helicase
MIHFRFEEAGFKSAYQDGATSSADRADIKRAFHNGQLDMVCNIGTLTQGVDWDVRCLVLARPTKSEMLYTQIVGRALRTATGKDHAVILDHSNSTLELGLVTDIHHDALDDGKPKVAGKTVARKKPLPRECPVCCNIQPRVNRTCQQCGFQFPITCKVVEQDGVLDEYSRDMGKAANRKYTMQQKEQFYAELLGLAQQKGYKPGWAFYKYKEKFGVEVPSAISKVDAREPSFELYNWIKGMQIRWREAQKNGQHLQAAE